jgi:hypothetical protein
MSDSTYIVVIIGFFALAIAYAHACDKLHGGDRD